MEDEIETEEGETITKPKPVEKSIKKTNKLGSTSQSENIERYLSPALCQAKPFKSLFGEAMASGRIPLGSPEPEESQPPTESREDKRKAGSSPGSSPGFKPPPKMEKSGIPKGSVPKKEPK